MTTAVPAPVWLEEGGALVRIRLARPKANIVDADMTAAIDAHVSDYADNASVKAFLIDSEGEHFSFGASVEEHRPEQCAAMLAGFHALIRKLVASPVPVLTAVRGQCLGGGMELALAGDLIFAAPDAKMGQPEIKLGVFAPAASCLLPERIGRARAHDLLLSGRSVDAEYALAIGLVHAVDDDPAGAALDYFSRHLAPHSAAALRCATRAARLGVAERVGAALDAVERIYLDDLMATRDAVEGIEAFLEKRPAKWEDR